jgi:hypothetical protein
MEGPSELGMELITSDVVWSWSTLEYLVWTGISQVVSSLYLLIVRGCP